MFRFTITLCLLIMQVFLCNLNYNIRSIRNFFCSFKSFQMRLNYSCLCNYDVSQINFLQAFIIYLTHELRSKITHQSSLFLHNIIQQPLNYSRTTSVSLTILIIKFFTDIHDFKCQYHLYFSLLLWNLKVQRSLYDILQINQYFSTVSVALLVHSYTLYPVSYTVYDKIDFCNQIFKMS